MSTENSIISKSLELILKHISKYYNWSVKELIYNELIGISGVNVFDFDIEQTECIEYDDLQSQLATINEKSAKRKNNGVYYTPYDVVQFICSNSIKVAYDNVDEGNLSNSHTSSIPLESFCFDKKVFDPTCGAGEFLIDFLTTKFDFFSEKRTNISDIEIKKMVMTLYGNDIDYVSICISKLRILLVVLNRYGPGSIIGLSEILNTNFTCYDFVNRSVIYKFSYKFDIIVGNPPYVESQKYDEDGHELYGNIYANVLDNVVNCLEDDGVLGFIIPLSYISTPRMKKLRNLLCYNLATQYILSFCDRPDCLFTSVHQKLCIIIGKKDCNCKNSSIYTSDYLFWYKNERNSIFSSIEIEKNNHRCEDFIPKLGSQISDNIYSKVISYSDSLLDILSKGSVPVYLNMRCAFWIKSFRCFHESNEYKEFKCINNDIANLCFCVLNSSLFWWLWVCISDCWHITRKELKAFTVPEISDFNELNMLANDLERELELKKVYVGTVQTEYEYKHKACVDTIHRIDDYIAKLYHLSEEENLYIKRFAYKYRVNK